MSAPTGVTLRVVPRGVYDFSGLAANLALNLPVAQHIDVTPFTEADLVVRFHGPTTSGGSTGSQITTTTGIVLIALVQDGYDFEDPATPFLPSFGTLVGASPGVVQVNSASSFPFASTVQIAGVIPNSLVLGRYLTVMIIGRMGANIGTLRVTVSIDLILKGGDASGLPISANEFLGYYAQ